MKRHDTNVCTFEATLQETPKVFNAVRVDVAINVSFGVIDDLMNEIGIQANVGSPHIREEDRGVCYVLSHRALQGFFISVRSNLRSRSAVTLNRSHDDCFANAAASLSLGFAFPLVDVARLAADECFECFVGFNFAGKLETTRSHGKADSVQENPSRLLSDAKRAVNLIRTNTVLAVGDHPDGRQPLVKTERAIFHDRAELDGELLFASLALP